MLLDLFLIKSDIFIYVGFIDIYSNPHKGVEPFLNHYEIFILSLEVSNQSKYVLLNYFIIYSSKKWFRCEPLDVNNI